MINIKEKRRKNVRISDMIEDFIKELFEENGLPVSLSALGADEEMINKTVEETMKSYALVTNPRNVTKEDVYSILRSVM